MKLEFYLKFRTRFGQSLTICGNIPALGEKNPGRALPMQFLNEEYWYASIEIDESITDSIHYRYIYTNELGEEKREAEKERYVELKKTKGDLILIDTWNDGSFYENAFSTAPFREVFFRGHKFMRLKKNPASSIQFKVKAPLVTSNEVVCLLGNTPETGLWDVSNPLLLQKNGDWWTIELPLSDQGPISYKYGVYNIKRGEFVRYENGDNRILLELGSFTKNVVVHDGFVRLPNNTWKGAGIAIPVFALRSQCSFGIGEFTDIKLLVDWAEETGLKLIQLLPINDTSATFTWKDSYPYAAISAFALHPIYINLEKVAGKKHANIIRSLGKKQKQLNALPEIDYEQVIQFKMNVLFELYELQQMAFLEEEECKAFFSENRHWLMPYAAFCHLRDKWGTSDYSKWRTHSVYNQEDIEKLCSPKSKSFHQIAFHYYVQYHLHLQLKDATNYAHKRGIAVKGDIPIGIYRYGCDAWTAPELYNMNMQAGAPPDDFTIKGQNWGFPTYNWKKMEEDHFTWWRQRFSQMSNYFDAFRIDHILGFFRIWSIPTDAVEGILGRFIPALPLHVTEFGERGIWFDYDRFCKPYITDGILQDTFGDQAEIVKETFLQENASGGYDLKEPFSTQRKVEAYFEAQETSDQNALLKQGLYDLITNVILYEQPGSDQKEFHFRILIELTATYNQLDGETRRKLKELYVDYFYKRQDDFWKHEAMKKLPALKEATNMLIAGEDLGMVPHCVPEVMQNLGILSLEIQRMPKNPLTEFFHPKDAPYLSVITPSTHDMSTIRGWWEENREKTQKFYNTILGENGHAPYFCESWVNRAIVLQHLYAPAMWSIFQMQDILGMSDTLRRENPAEERINDPANPNHYWNYRMHIGLEQLLKEKEFNNELRDYIRNSGRA
jgi:4-alpha-glucanotransferase